MDMEYRMDRKHWEGFFDVARGSLSVNNYSQFNEWLYSKFSNFLPHEMMVYHWGDFGGARAHGTSVFMQNQKMVLLNSSSLFRQTAKALYDKWLSNNSRWFMLNYTDPLFAKIHFDENPDLQAFECQSVLVYGVREAFGGATSLYVFLSKEPSIEVDHYVIGMLMPYLDSTIKRIRGVASAIVVDDYSLLTVRELEVMNWVNKGKTNYEIGQILSISHNTVKNHLKIIFKKLNVISRAQAVSKFSMYGRGQEERGYNAPS